MARGKLVYVKAPQKKKYGEPGQWAQSKKYEVLTNFAASGNMRQTALQAGVPWDTCKQWQKQEWFIKGLEDIRNEDYGRLDAKLSKALDKALDNVLDRIENGESMYDPTTGKLKKVPAKLRDLNTSFNSLMDKRQLIRKQPTKIVEQQTTADQLQNLASEFAKFVTGKIKEERLDELINPIEGETVELQPDGTYAVIEKEDTEDAVHD